MNSIDIDRSLLKAKQILDDYPDLYNKTTDEILDIYENDKKMLHDRWSIAAYVLLSRIQNYEPLYLIQNLPDREFAPLLFDYAGYILQNEHSVDFENLIIESDKYGKFNIIIKYAVHNLKYNKNFNSDNITALVDIIYKNNNEDNSRYLISEYAKHIINCKAYLNVIEKIPKIRNTSEYYLLKNVASDWYKNDNNQADKYCECCLASDEILEQRLAIYYLSYSIYYDTVFFEKHITDIDRLYDVDNEIKKDIIALFISYLVINKGKNQTCQNIIMKRMETLPTDSSDIKATFIDRISYIDKVPDYLIYIYMDIIQRPLSDKTVLTNISSFLYMEIKRKTFRDPLQDLLTIFKANDYTANYDSFFSIFSSVFSELNEQNKYITEQALIHIVSSDINEVFFGLGLIENTSDVLICINELDLSFTEEQILQIIKALLYFSHNTNLVCGMVFALFKCAKQELTVYSQFCLYEVFENYPVKMYDYSKEHFNDLSPEQKRLAQTIIESFESRLEKQKVVKSIKDMNPSFDHQRIILKAQNALNRNQLEKAEAMSFLGDLFPKQKMKYGKRISYVINQKHGVKEFQESSYQSISHSVFLPMQYVSDPIAFYEKKASFFQEVKNNAIDN